MVDTDSARKLHVVLNIVNNLLMAGFPLFLRKFLQMKGKKRKYKIKGNMKEILKN